MGWRIRPHHVFCYESPGPKRDMATQARACLRCCSPLWSRVVILFISVALLRGQIPILIVEGLSPEADQPTSSNIWFKNFSSTLGDFACVNFSFLTKSCNLNQTHLGAYLHFGFVLYNVPFRASLLQMYVSCLQIQHGPLNLISSDVSGMRRCPGVFRIH